MSQDEVRHCAAQVQSYLCADPAMFIATEYLAELGGKTGKVDRTLDFLAWHDREERLFVGEVTTNKGIEPNDAAGLARRQQQLKMRFSCAR